MNTSRKQVVSDLVVQGTDQVRHNQFPRRKLAAELIEFAFQPRVSAKAVDGTMLCRGHQPGAWIFRDARLRPLLQRGYQRVLGEVLGNAEVAHHPHQAGDEPGRLDSPDRIDCSMCVGCRHSYPSHHLQFPVQAGRQRAHALLRLADCNSGNPAAASCTSAGKSENSCTWRTSMTQSSPGHRVAHSMASSLDFTWIIQ